MSNDHRLTLIVGAGASAEAGLPVGAELKNTIAGLVDVRFEFPNRLVQGDPSTWAAIKASLGESIDQESLSSLNKKAWAVAAAMPQAPSIDTFIDSHRDDPRVATIGKIAVARAILNAERQSGLFVDERQAGQSESCKRVVDATSESWFSAFFTWLADGCTLTELADRLSRTSCIVFNYDRCIEHFMPHAISNYYDVPLSDATEVASSMEILHPYGSLGALDDKQDGRRVPFGTELHPTALLEASGSITTFTEQQGPERSVLNTCRSRVAECRGLVFLGFAFHAQNMNYLFGDGATDRRRQRIFGTAYGISEADRQSIHGVLQRLAGARAHDVFLGSFRCRQLFHEFSHSLAELRRN